MKLSNNTKIMQTLNSKLLFNVDIEENYVNEIIASDDFTCINYIYHINNLIKYKNVDILKHKQIFYKNQSVFDSLKILNGFTFNKDILFDKDNCIASHTSCINIIERIIKYGKFKNNNLYDMNDNLLTKMLLLNIFETSINEKHDIDSKSNEILNLYLSIITYNQFPNDIDNSGYFRISYIYDTYIKNEKEILDKFEEKTGYSVKNYLLFLKLFLLLGTYSNPLISTGIFKDCPDAIQIKKCISDHLFNLKSKEEKNQILINSYIPSQILIDKPLIMIEDKYLTLNPKFLIDRIHDIFFTKIKRTLNNNAIYQKRFYGPLIENYCRDIAKQMVKKSNFKFYTFIDEFEYEINNNIIKSSDFYITYNDITIIFEIKSTKRFEETTIETDIEGKEKFIEEEINEKIKKPLKQIEKRLNEVQQLNCTLYPNIPLDKIQKSNKFYYVVVSDESITNNFKIYNEYLTKLNIKYSHCLPLYLNIAEFEFLMMSLCKRKKTIDIVIDYYHKHYYNSNFIDMIMKDRKTFKFNRLDIFNNDAYLDEIKSILK